MTDLDHLCQHGFATRREAPARQHHGGTDATGVARLDFSTNSNACGPCPQALAAVREADATRYPDPGYTALRQALAQWHGVAPWQIVPGASSSELIHRLLLWARLHGVAHAIVPTPAYGDYAHQAVALGLHTHARAVGDAGLMDLAGQGASGPKGSAAPAIEWACQPSSPQGQADARLARWSGSEGTSGDAAGLTDAAHLRVLDAAYEPLVLADDATQWLLRARARQAHCWQLFSPNKSLGLTGVRAAYAIAPSPPKGAHTSQQMVAELEALAPSWPLGAHGEAMLQAWMQSDVQAWLAQSRRHLQAWKQAQIALCHALGWQVTPGSLANYLVVQPDLPLHTTADGTAWLEQVLRRLRHAHQIKLRDTTSMGLPGRLRISVQPPDAQAALAQAWLASLPSAWPHQTRSIPT